MTDAGSRRRGEKIRISSASMGVAISRTSAWSTLGVESASPSVGSWISAGTSIFGFKLLEEATSLSYYGF